MEAVSTPNVINFSLPKTQVHSGEILTIFEQFASKIKVLSLDCFDTIIWRKTAAPSDLFYDLANRPAFKAKHFSTVLRLRAEVQARKDMTFRHGKNEVKLPDIYKASFPSLTAAEINALVAEELAAEGDVCYAYPPIVELIRVAHARGIKIVVVSDTYLDSNQLKNLLQAKLPADAFAAISQIFCSSEYGIAKYSGLFKHVISTLAVSPNSIFHIGDNHLADFIAAKNAGCHSTQLIYHPETTFNDIQRMQVVAATILDPTIRNKRSMISPFHGVLANSSFSYTDAKASIGYASIGPIMYSMAKFISDEVAAFAQDGKQVKVLFLMRDAYLPYLACEAYLGKKLGHCASISRFAAFAAAFDSHDKINRYLADNVISYRFHDMCKQLLIPEKHAQEIIYSCEQASDKLAEFVRQINRPEILQMILNESRSYRKRLYTYLEKTVDLKQDDTLMLVDLGYSGTTQRELQAIFKQELNVDIIGRYLIQMVVPDWEKTRRGLLDPSWCDDRTLNTVVGYIAMLEQISTSNGKSVVNYDDQGEPIYSESGISAKQHTKLAELQTECLHFITDAKRFFANTNVDITLQDVRDATLAALGRFLFLPTKDELNYMSQFQFDLSLGTSDLIQVFDIKAGLEGLRKRGLFFMEKNLKTMRTNYPSELRSAGIDLVLMLMGEARFGYEIRVSDVSHRREVMQVIVMNGMRATQTKLSAIPTYDGYYSLIAPVGNGDYQLGVLFGLNYQWVQLECADLIRADALYSSKESEHTEDASRYLAVDRMSDRGGGVYECHSDTGMVVFAGPKNAGNMNYVLRIVFRPLVMREVKAEQGPAHN